MLVLEEYVNGFVILNKVELENANVKILAVSKIANLLAKRQIVLILEMLVFGNPKSSNVDVPMI